MANKCELRDVNSSVGIRLRRVSGDKSVRAWAWLRLSSSLVLIAVIWGIVLPQVGKIPGMAIRLKTMDHYGIDASALFYTDLEIDLEVSEADG